MSTGRGREKRVRDLKVWVWLVFVGVLGWSARGAWAATALQGVGASFPSIVYLEAMNAYEQATEGVSVDYKAFGSGSGLCRIRDPTACTDSLGTFEVDFACSDSLLSSSNYSTYDDLQMYPMVAGAVVVAYNLPTSVGNIPLRVDDATLADIFDGSITQWDDAALVALNPGLSLPNTAIKVVLRSDSSGTTDVFTGALSDLDSNFNSAVGRTQSWNTASLPWSGMATRAQSIGVASYVRATEYSIGYVVLADAKLVNASIAGYMHTGASSPVFPNSDSIAEAVKTRGLQFGNNGDSPNRLTATVAPVTTNAPGVAVHHVFIRRVAHWYRIVLHIFFRST
jgi:phosphate transport system substrate-binding protein